MSNKNIVPLRRINSAQGNLQTHPCFQSDLYCDIRAAGLVKTWKEKNTQYNRPQSHFTESSTKKFDTRDYQLENTIWTQTVSY